VRAVNADPILATDGSGQGVTKISGSLVMFDAESDISNGGILGTDGGQLTITPGKGDSAGDATLLFELSGDPALAVGFMGYWTCNT